MLHGHYWTIRHYLTSRARPTPVTSSQAWFGSVRDPKLGTVRLSGRLALSRRSRSLLVLVHGLGGSSQSPYLLPFVSAAEALGMSSLRLNLRGADLRGEDLYHAGLSADLGAVLAAPEFAHFERIYLLGFSLGGHVSLHYATGNTDPRLRSVVAICPPLDLGKSATELDRPPLNLYRNIVLRGLKAAYHAVGALHPERAPCSWHEARKIQRIREWDALIVAPRHGYPSADAYYASNSVGGRLAAIRLPTLILNSREDPMVRIDSVREHTRGLGAPVRVFETEHGGHIGFPPSLSLGESTALGLVPQVLSWLERAEPR